MKKNLLQTSVFLLLTIGCYLICYLPASSFNTYTGEVIKVIANGHYGTIINQTVYVEVTSGSMKGSIHALDVPYDSAFATDDYKKGDSVFLGVQSPGNTLYINEYDRRGSTFLLIELMLILLFIIAGKQGFFSLLGMLASVVIVMLFVIPNILQGNNPVAYALLSTIIIIPITYYLAHGLHTKTTIAITSSYVTLALTFALAFLFARMLHIPSIVSTDDTAGYYTFRGTLINVSNLYLAGIIISGLAVLNDITISQASIVATLYKANRRLPLQELITHAMEVGKDHIASLINTLLLVFIGASFPFYLTFIKAGEQTGFDISNPLLSQEILKAVIISIGVILAVPISTILAAYVTMRKKVQP